MAGDESTLSHELKKSKKRKHLTDEDADDDDAQRKAERKERKRMKKLAKEAAAAAEQDTTTEPTSSEHKSKKSKSRKSKSDVSVDTTAVNTVANTPAPESTSTYLTDNMITVHDGQIVPFEAFDQVPIPEQLRPALSKFAQPTPIQACVWPPLFSGKDVVGIAETGSGKTLAFSLPVIARLATEIKSSKKGPSALISVLVLSPTRELAIQSHETLKELAEPFGFTSVCVYGGASKDGQRKALQGSPKMPVRIIVATPGRMLDFLQEGVISLSSVSYLVLDEADRMLDHGFENDIRTIIGQTMPGQSRQTLMFSATWPESVRRLASTFQRSPVRITVGSEELSANRRVEQVVEVLEERQKERRLNALLQSLRHPTGKQAAVTDSKILVFCLYKKEAARVENNLRYQGYSVAAIHGDLNQSAREKALADFKSGTAGLMVATDVAARGLDIPNVNFVINYTFPLTTEDYVHRIGRTGRGGKSGKSHTFFTGENHERALAGELARVLHDGGFECEGLKQFPMTVKKKEHSAYGAFFKDVSAAPSKGTKIKF